VNAVVHTSIPSPSISYVDLGPLRVHFYALCILTGIVIATWMASARLTARGGKPGMVLDIAMWTVPIGIVGGRLYHVVTHPTDYFFPGADLWKVLFVWEGGLAIFGSILFGSIGAYIGCRRAGIRFLSFADALAPGLLLAQAFGRFGNYFNHELYGGPTTLPWGLEIESTNVAFPTGLPAGTLFQPLFLYEMIWNAIGVVLIIFVLERRFTLRWGKALGFYLLWYGRAGHSWSPCDSTRRSSTSSDSRSTWTSLSWPPSPGSCSSSCRPDVTPGRETSIYLTPKKPPIDGLTAAAAPSGSHADVRPAVELPNGQMGDSRRDA
jgi:prolipoprotein diacylglyceryl transferase